MAKKTKKERPDKILLGLFTLLTIVCTSYYASLHDIGWLTLITFIPNELAEWIISPLLFLFVHSMLHQLPKEDNLLAKLSIVPLSVMLFISIPLLVYLVDNALLLPHIRFLVAHSSIYVFTSAIYNIFYMILSLRIIKYAKTQQSNFYAEDRIQEYKWIKLFLWMVILVFLVDLSTEIYELTIKELRWDSSYLTIAVLIFFIVYLAYFGTNHSKVLLPELVWTPPPPEVRIDEETQRKLAYVMANQKLFTNQSLTLSDLAKSIGVTDKKLSSLLNQQMKVSFYEYVNHYRLEHFEQLVRSNMIKTKTIFGLAQESGFKSKATFNRLFKQKHGLTPSDFCKKTLN